MKRTQSTNFISRDKNKNNSNHNQEIQILDKKHNEIKYLEKELSDIQKALSNFYILIKDKIIAEEVFSKN